jgi:hypothetical protein
MEAVKEALTNSENDKISETIKVFSCEPQPGIAGNRRQMIVFISKENL